MLNAVVSWFERRSARIAPAVANNPDFQFLQHTELMRDLSVAAKLFLFSRVVTRRYSRREMIFRDQNPGVCMFLIRQGGVELFVDDDDANTTRLAELNEGALFGEIATASGYNRTASARASRNDTLLLSISRFDLEDLNRHFPQDGMQVQRGITLSVIDSLIVTTDQLTGAQRTIEQLQRQLARYEGQ